MQSHNETMSRQYWSPTKEKNNSECDFSFTLVQITPKSGSFIHILLTFSLTKVILSTRQPRTHISFFSRYVKFLIFKKSFIFKWWMRKLIKSIKKSGEIKWAFMYLFYLARQRRQAFKKWASTESERMKTQINMGKVSKGEGISFSHLKDFPGGG